MVKAYLHNKPERFLTKLASADTVVVHALEPPVPLQFIYSKDLHDHTSKQEVVMLFASLRWLLASVTMFCGSEYLSLQG